MQYPPQVEQWRSTVAKYFPANLVDKALWVINYESGGNPGAVGDNGVARGLFQIQDGRAFAGRPDSAWLDTPENNIKYAAQALGAAGGNFSAWGEGTSSMTPFDPVTGKGKFGALGNNPYPGASNLSTPPEGNGAGYPSTSTSSDGFKVVSVPGGKYQVVNEFGEPVGSPYSPNDPSNGRGPDHFFDLSPADQSQIGLDTARLGLDQNKFDYQKTQDAATSKFNQAQADRDWALKNGDYELAKQKQADANYWQGIASGQDQQRINLTNQGQQFDYAAAMAQVGAQREKAANDYAVGMAGATNDAERNQITDKWNQQQALLAQAEDNTKRLLGQQSNQTNQFGAETDRQARMGTLGLENNKFIADMASNPRMLPELFMMQRGIAPDWDRMAAGMADTHGSALAPVDVMHAYDPVTKPPTFNEGNQSIPIVSGNTAQGAAGNPFIRAQAPGAAVGGSGVAAPAAIPYTAPQASYLPPSASAPDTLDRNAGMGQSNNGVPLSSLRPGLNQSTVSSGTKGSDFTMPAYYDQAKTRPVGANDTFDGTSQVWIDVPKMAEGGVTTAGTLMTGDAVGNDPERGGARPEIIGNPTNAPLTIQPHPANVSDAQQAQAPTALDYRRADWGGGGIQPAVTKPVSPIARPMGLAWNADSNSERRQMAADWGRPMPASAGVTNAQPAVAASQPRDAGMQSVAAPTMFTQTAGAHPGFEGQERTPAHAAWNDPMQGMETMQLPDGSYASVPAGTQAGAYQTASGVMGTRDFYSPPPAVSRPYDAVNGRLVAPAGGFGQLDYAPAQRQAQAAAEARQRAIANWGNPRDQFAQRFALGTQQTYENNGMGSAYIPESGNGYLAGQDLPTRLKMLADRGMPIGPGLAASATGRIAPPLNVAGAVTQGRQAGVLPSLQSLGRQTKSETEATRGYFEGVAGVPWADIVDWLQKPTEFLGAGARAKGM